MMPDATSIDRVGQDVMDVTIAEGSTPFYSSRYQRPNRSLQSLGIDCFPDQPNVPVLEVEIVDRADDTGIGFSDSQRPAIGGIAKWHGRPHPQAFLLRSGDFVPDPFCSDLALKLGKA